MTSFKQAAWAISFATMTLGIQAHAVDRVVPDEFSTIQSAVDAAQPADSVPSRG